MTDAEIRAIADRAFAAFSAGLGGDLEAIERFCALLDPAVVLHFPRNLKFTQPEYHGHDGARAVFTSVFDRVPAGLTVFPAWVLQGGNRVAYQFADHGQLPDDSWYRNAITLTLEVAPTGLITRTWEFLGGPHYFTRDGIVP